MTFPNLTILNRVELVSALRDWMMISANLLVAPMTFAGLTALSVEIITKELTPPSIAARARLLVPRILFSDAFAKLLSSSTKGTCLYAAA